MTKDELMRCSPEEQAFIVSNHLEGCSKGEIEEIAKNYDLLVWQGWL